LFAPGVADVAPPCEIFPRIESNLSFMLILINKEMFNKVCFIERKYITGEVIKTLENEIPFSDMSIPASGNTRIAVGLGIGVFLAMGIVPSSNSLIENI